MNGFVESAEWRKVEIITATISEYWVLPVGLRTPDRLPSAFPEDGGGYAVSELNLASGS